MKSFLPYDYNPYFNIEEIPRQTSCIDDETLEVINTNPHLLCDIGRVENLFLCGQKAVALLSKDSLELKVLEPYITQGSLMKMDAPLDYDECVLIYKADEVLAARRAFFLLSIKQDNDFSITDHYCELGKLLGYPQKNIEFTIEDELIKQIFQNAATEIKNKAIYI